MLGSMVVALHPPPEKGLAVFRSPVALLSLHFALIVDPGISGGTRESLLVQVLSVVLSCDVPAAVALCLQLPTGSRSTSGPAGRSSGCLCPATGAGGGDGADSPQFGKDGEDADAPCVTFRVPRCEVFEVLILR